MSNEILHFPINFWAVYSLKTNPLSVYSASSSCRYCRRV